MGTGVPKEPRQRSELAQILAQGLRVVPAGKGAHVARRLAHRRRQPRHELADHLVAERREVMRLVPVGRRNRSRWLGRLRGGRREPTRLGLMATWVS
jgi:hypothetical protein